MKVALSFFIVSASHVLSLVDEKTYEKFLIWKDEHASPIRLPWGDIVYNLEEFVVEEEDFQNQEEVFTKCSLEIQNLIYKLKQIQLKENDNCKFQLVFE